MGCGKHGLLRSAANALFVIFTFAGAFYSDDMRRGGSGNRCARLSVAVRDGVYRLFGRGRVRVARRNADSVRTVRRVGDRRRRVGGVPFRKRNACRSRRCGVGQPYCRPHFGGGSDGGSARGGAGQGDRALSCRGEDTVRTCRRACGRDGRRTRGRAFRVLPAAARYGERRFGHSVRRTVTRGR